MDSCQLMMKPCCQFFRWIGIIVYPTSCISEQLTELNSDLDGTDSNIFSRFPKASSPLPNLTKELFVKITDKTFC
jgi:hypothetical protein